MSLKLHKDPEEAPAKEEAQAETPAAETQAAKASAPAPAATPPAASADADQQEKEKKSTAVPVKQSKPGILQKLILNIFVVFEFIFQLKIIIPVLVLSVGGFFAYTLGINFYHEQLFESAKTDFAEKNYPQAISKLTKYNAFAPDNAESVVLMAKSNIHLGNFSAAEKILNEFQRAHPAAIAAVEYEFYQALLKLLQNRTNEAKEHIVRLFLNDNNSLFGHYMQAAIVFYEQNNMPEVISVLAEGIENAKNADSQTLATAKELIEFARKLLQKNNPTAFSEQLPLPFNELRDPPEVFGKRAGVNIGILEPELTVEGFYNLYYLPSSDEIIEEQLSTLDSMYLLQALAAISDGKIEEAEQNLESMEGKTSSSLLHYSYLAGYITAKKGDYRRAVDIYRNLLESTPSADANMLYASALWGANNGAAPTDEMIDTYTEALNKQPNYLPPLINLAYLHMHRRELTQARTLLENAFKQAPNSFHTGLNLSLLDIWEDHYENAKTNLLALRANWAGSLSLTKMLAYVLASEGEYSEAVAQINDLKKYNHIPEAYLAIARLHETNNQALLAIAELAAGRKIFPENDDILLELFFQYAQQRDIKKYTALRGVIPEQQQLSDYRALLAAALLTETSADADPYFWAAVGQAQTPREKIRVLSHWARILLDHRQDRQALEKLQLASEIYSDRDNLPLQLQVLQIWAEALTSSPGSARAKTLLEDLALLEYEKFSKRTQIDIAFALIALGEHQQAVDILEPLSRSLSNKRLLSALASAYSNLQDTTKAQSIARRLTAIEAQEEDQRQEYMRLVKKIREAGLVFAQSGDDTLRSVGDDSETEVIASGDEALVDRLNQAVKDKDYQTAADIYGRLLEGGSERFTPAIVHQNRGVLYIKLKDYEQAAVDFEKALALGELKEKDEKSVLYNYSLVLLETKKYDRGHQIMQQLLALEPDNLRTLLLYSQLLRKLNKFNELIETYKKIIGMAPEQVVFYIRLAEVYRILGQPETGLEWLNEGLAIDSRSKSLHKAIAEMYTFLGNTQKAQQHLDIIKSL